MPSESSLLVTQVPASFVTIGEKHNALVDLLRTMTGTGGCKVTFSENKIIINVPTLSITSSDIPDPLTVDTIYNTTFNGGAIYGSTLNVTTIASTDAGISSVTAFDELAVLNAGVASLQIMSASVTRNMSIKEIDVCSGGVAKKMLILASDPY